NPLRTNDKQERTRRFGEIGEGASRPLMTLIKVLTGPKTRRPKDASVALEILRNTWLKSRLIGMVAGIGMALFVPALVVAGLFLSRVDLLNRSAAQLRKDLHAAKSELVVRDEKIEQLEKS